MIRFADFDLDPAALRICRGGAGLDASPQTVEVLAFLIENRERTVGRSELLDRFWPRSGTGGDAALNTCIRRIRSLLDDDADTPRFVQTRPRSGYRFIGTIDADDPEAGLERPTAGGRRSIAAGAVLTAIAIGGAVWAQGAMFPTRHRIAIEPVKGLCEYVLFPHFNAGLRESFIAETSRRLPANYSVAANGQKADLHARVVDPRLHGLEKGDVLRCQRSPMIPVVGRNPCPGIHVVAAQAVVVEGGGLRSYIRHQS